jgi:hypothetical protein
VAVRQSNIMGLTHSRVRGITPTLSDEGSHQVLTHKYSKITHLEAEVRFYEVAFEKMNDLRESIHDVIFVVKGRNIYANRVVLAARSEYFQNMFDGEFKESRTPSPVVIEVDYASFQAFDGLITSFYTNKPIEKIEDNETILEMLSLCDRFNIRFIKDYLYCNLTWKITEEDRLIQILVDCFEWNVPFPELLESVQELYHNQNQKEQAQTETILAKNAKAYLAVVKKIE